MEKNPFEELAALRERPRGKVVMRQSWRDLTFIHWAVEPELVQGKLPPGLEVDTFDGQAYLSFIPFWMHSVRLPFAPAVPGMSTFNEWNFRTYVRRKGQDPGIWFFSLEASNLPAVLAARATYKLPYCFAQMSRSLEHPELRYVSKRLWPGPKVRVSRCRAATFGEPVVADWCTLTYWLVERYLLYTAHRGRLFRARVHHDPYAVAPATFAGPKLDLWRANGFASLPTPLPEAQYSPGVDVEVFGLERCD